ncbi:MAG: prepilin peptidase [Verrucomicrobiota bacterium]
MGIDPIFDAHNWELVPFHFWSLVFFVFGCIVGSFLNVCIYRLPLGMSIVTPPSHCPHCQYSIPWYLNVPLVTWLALRGRCKNCGAPISPRYFIVELLTGVAFLGCWLAFGKVSPVIAILYAILLAGLIAATFIDFEHFIIPDEITYGGMAVGLIVSFLFPVLHDVSRLTAGMWQSVLGLGAGAGIIYAILRLGKLLFGRQRLKLPVDTKIVFTETSVHLPDREIPYDELFYRQSDVIALRARTVELVDRGYRDVMVRLALRSGWLEIGGERLIHGRHRRVRRLAGGAVLADGQFDDRRGGRHHAHYHATARMVVTDAVWTLHCDGRDDLDFWRKENYPRHF